MSTPVESVVGTDQVPAPSPHTPEIADMPQDPTLNQPRTSRGSGRRKKGWSAARRAAYEASRAAGSPAASSARTASTSKKPAGPDYKAGILGLFQLVAFPLGLAAQRTHNVALAADAATLTIHAEPVATGITTVAKQDERLAAILDRIMTVGPYGALLQPVMAMAMQLAANHGLIPESALESMHLKTADQVMAKAAQMQAA